MNNGKKINIPQLGNVYYSNLVNTSVLGGTSNPVPNPSVGGTTSSNSSSHLSNLNNILLHSSGNVYHQPAGKPPTVFTQPPPVVTPPPLLVTPVPVVPILSTPLANPSDSGGMGGGGGGSTDDSGVSQKAGVSATTGKSHTMAIASFSLLATAGGATAGYFLAKHFKKSPMLFSAIGAVALGLATFGITKYVVYKPQSTSSFLGFGNKKAKNKYALTVKCKDELGAVSYHKGGCPEGTTGASN